MPEARPRVRWRDSTFPPTRWVFASALSCCVDKRCCLKVFEVLYLFKCLIVWKASRKAINPIPPLSTANLRVLGRGHSEIKKLLRPDPGPVVTVLADQHVFLLGNVWPLGLANLACLFRITSCVSVWVAFVANMPSGKNRSFQRFILRLITNGILLFLFCCSPATKTDAKLTASEFGGKTLRSRTKASEVSKP